MLVYAVVGILLFITTGCHKQQQIVLDIPEIVTDSERNREKEKNLNAAEAVASVYNDIYVEACGLIIQDSDKNLSVKLRVVTDVGTALYKIDRWD